MIQLIKLGGTDKQLYKLVGPLVMNPDVLRKNNNYPFKTTENFIWFVAVEGKRVIGFLPVERRSKSMTINNYYVCENGEEVLARLLSEVIETLGTSTVLSSVTLVEHRSVFQKYGFEVDKEWKLYVKMHHE